MRLFAIACLLGCTEPHDVSEPLSVEPQLQLFQQLQRGAAVYAVCAECHGAIGQGTPDGPALIGPAALARAPHGKRDIAFECAADVLVWIAKAMPADDPGTLTSEQAFAVLAFLLSANGVALARPLDLVQAHEIALQRDDRHGLL